MSEPERVPAPVEELDTHDYTGDLKESWLYVYLIEADKAKHTIRPKDATAVGADKGHSRRSVFRLFDALANAGLAQSRDGAGFPRITYWSAVDGTTGPVSLTAGTTGTTGPDLHKRGGTTALNDDTGGTTAGMPSDQAEQEHDRPVVPVVPADPEIDVSTPIPGDPTNRTPGLTDRVTRALANAAHHVAHLNPRCACGAELTRPESIAARCCEECRRFGGREQSA